MEIQYFGQSCFRLRNSQTIVLTDPFSPKIGLKFPKTTAEIITISHQHEDHNNYQAVAGTEKKATPFIISGPGEYEISGITIFGLASTHGNKLGDNTIYTINIDGLKIVHLGDLGQVLTDKQIEELNSVDILMIPVGGEYTLDAKGAIQVIKQLEPKIILPMHYRLPGLIYPLALIDDFIKDFDQSRVQKLAKLIMSQDKLPEEQQIIVLNARN